LGRGTKPNKNFRISTQPTTELKRIRAILIGTVADPTIAQDQSFFLVLTGRSRQWGGAYMKLNRMTNCGCRFALLFLTDKIEKIP
jgi:hypothetical protein